MSGDKLALGAVAALAALGIANKRRGSRDLEEIVLAPGVNPDRVSTPFKGLVGAARGGGVIKKYEKAFARAPFNLRVVLIRNERNDTDRAEMSRMVEAALRQPQGTVTLLQNLPSMSPGASIALIQNTRRQSRAESFAIMTPFTLAHRLFDACYTTYSTDLGEVIGMAVADHDFDIVSDVVTNLPGLDEAVDQAVIDQQAIRKEHADADEEEMEDYFSDARYEAAIEARYEQAEAVAEAVTHFIELREASVYLEDEDYEDLADMPEWVDLTGRYPDGQEFTNRVFTSLMCPTAAGRRMLLTSPDQAAADCFATWVLSYNSQKGRGAIPWRVLDADELLNFDPDQFANRWYEDNKHKRMVTERKRDKYAAELRRYASVIDFMSNLEHGDGVTVAEFVAELSQTIADQMPDLMLGAVTLLKAQKVVRA